MLIRLRLLMVVLVVAGGAEAMLRGADAAAPATSRWLRWLKPLPWHGGKPTPEVPSPMLQPDQNWTIGAALRRALQANPDVQVALATVQRQDGVRLQTLSVILPRLTAVASADERDPSLIDRSAAELAAAGNPVNPTPLAPIATRSYNAQVEVRQPIFDGFAGWNQVKRAALLQKKASVDARDLYLRVASQVRQAFDATLIRRQVVEARQDAVRDLTHLADVAQKRYSAGQISEFESLRAQTAQRSAEADLAQAQADLSRSEELLCRMLYIDRPGGGLRLVGDAAPTTYTETFDAALAHAKGARLDVRSAQLQLEAARLAQRVAAAGLLPRLEISANYAYRSSYYNVQRQLDGWSVGVVGRWDIFDGLQTAGAIRTQNADRRIAELRLAEAQKTVGSQLRELFATLDQSKSVMASHASARDFGERGLREARAMYDAGKISLEEVLNAEIAYRQARVGWLGAVFSYNTTVYQLDYATADETFLERLTAEGR